jgi:membrane fusion protein (multidrug efflux system)
MRMHTNFLVSALTVIALATLSGCSQGQSASGPPPASEPEVTVATIAPQQVTLTTELAGRTSPFLVAEVRPQVGGIIQKRLFKEGADVKAGELLYQIDPSTYQAAYDVAKSALAKAQANALPAKLKAERFASLSKVNAVSRQDNDDAQAANGQAQAEVLSARAALESARINLSYTRVTAPIAGRIGKSAVTPGALVTASQALVLATVQQLDPIYVDVTQSSGEVLRMKRDLASGKLKKAGADGAKVKLFFEDGSPYAQEGVLQFSDVTVDQSTGVLTLRAVFPNPNHNLLPGLYVRAVLEEGVEDQALLAPQRAVSRDSKGTPLVMVVKPDGVVEARPIETGRVVGDNWLVTSGLAAGERIIVDGLQKVRPGAKVKAVEAAAPAPAQANATAQAPQAEPQPQAAAPEKQAPAQDVEKPAAKQELKPEAKTEKEAAKAVKVVKVAERVKAGQAKAAVGPDGLARPRKGEALVYSPFKDQPWPRSELRSESKPEHTADQQ